MNINEEIKSAIARSISQNEIVKVEIDGDSGDALRTIRQVWDGAADYSMSDYEGKDRLGVWGWTEATKENEQDWGLDITFA